MIPKEHAPDFADAVIPEIEEHSSVPHGAWQKFDLLNVRKELNNLKTQLKSHFSEMTQETQRITEDSEIEGAPANLNAEFACRRVSLSMQ